MITVLPNKINRSGERGDSGFPHVLLVLDQFPKVLGGGERMVLKLAYLLPKYGYRASVLTFYVHPDCEAVKSALCPIYVLPLRRTYDLNALSAAFELQRFLRFHQIQIVQTFFESSDLWAGFVTKMAPHVKLIWSRRDMGILRTRKHRIAYRLMAGLPDAVFSVSEKVRQYCIDVDRIDAAKVQTIYNGHDVVDQDLTEEPNNAAGLAHIVALGNIRRVKGFDVLIRAAADILPRFAGVTFSIAGEILEPSYYDELRALIRDLGLVDHFSFVGGVTDARKYLATGDIFVLPSRSEGFSNSIVEAMAASLPVIATHVGGNAEAVEDGVTGFIVPPDDSEAVSGALIRLLSDPLRAKTMGLAGKSVAAKLFSMEAMMAKTVATYKRLLA